MTPTDISKKLAYWSDSADDTSIDVNGLWAAFHDLSLGDKAEEFWKSIPQELAFQFLSIEVLDRLTPACELRSLLDRAEPFIDSGVTRAHWRALRMIAGEPGQKVESMFWQDFLSDDVLLSSRAAAVVAPAVARGDEKYIAHLKQLRDGLNVDEAARMRIDRALGHRF